MENVIIEAIEVASHYHRNQTRKFSGEPYIKHPLRVADILMFYGETDPEVLSAAILHDTLEDTELTHSVLEAKFGARVTRLVDETSYFPSPGLTRKEKLVEFCEKLKDISSEGATIKVADILDNCSDLLEKNHEFAKVFFPEKLVMLDHLKQANPKIWEYAVKWLVNKSKHL